MHRAPTQAVILILKSQGFEWLILNWSGVFQTWTFKAFEWWLEETAGLTVALLLVCDCGFIIIFSSALAVSFIP